MNLGQTLFVGVIAFILLTLPGPTFSDTASKPFAERLSRVRAVAGLVFVGCLIRLFFLLGESL